MEQRMERLELEVGKVSFGQEKLLEKVTERMHELFAALSNCIDNLSTPPPNIHEGSSQSPVHGFGIRNNGNDGMGSSIQANAPKLVKLDFPRFNGNEDPTSWLCRVEQFFEFQRTLEEEKVALASFLL
ncbi:hypothetical protein Patl1_05485 [Pistacia atlantica]|uniref:Uncharacterized protein n=1 Tax=Pistacia atlantica TaxID=434234 RepID=A0ACC1BR72_9ROSI|nr:hypothetical protein Patl1_05485 [Pistacia atlantica]